MREKELRVALVCSGGISLAVTMHGVTKEIWHATRASRSWRAGEAPPAGVAGVYAGVLETIGQSRALALRFVPDIVSGASAGGINAVFLAQALITGQSLDGLTQLWLKCADSDELIAPEARPWGRLAKIWAWPVVWLALRAPDAGLDDVRLSRATRAEVRAKVSRLIRARWFRPPFSGMGFSRVLADALTAMEVRDDETTDGPLLPPGHPLDLAVTVTDLAGHRTELVLNSPPLVEEAEHRLTIGFHAVAHDGATLAPLTELVLAARSTASFPGAFPPLNIREIDTLAQERGWQWPGRNRFLKRIMPERWAEGSIADAALIDGAVLNNRPFAQAMLALRDRPARREVDRRFVYIEPNPALPPHFSPTRVKAPGFFATIFASLSTIPREQPIRDNLDTITHQSRERERLRALVETLRPDIEAQVAKLFGHTLFFESPSRARLTSWRARAQKAAEAKAGYAYHAYARVKLDSIVADLAKTIALAAPEAGSADHIAAALSAHLGETGLDQLVAANGRATPESIAFFRTHDIGYRIRRLKLLARRLTEGWAEEDPAMRPGREAARSIVYQAQALYQARETGRGLGPGFADSAQVVLRDPGSVLAAIAARRDLATIDLEVDAMMVDALHVLDRALRRRFLHAYLGFVWYDTATLPLSHSDGGEGMGEFDPIKVDRISPEDAASIRKGGAAACLKGVGFYNFGAFFSRAYRENDYLWGRLHGAERVIDIIASSVEPALEDTVIAGFKRKAFLAILDEEEPRLTSDPALVPGIRSEVEAAFSR